MAAARSLVIIADVGPDHFHVGDEAMLEANLAALRLRAPNVDVRLFGRAAAPASERYLVNAALAQADGLFISGGGNLSSSWPDLLWQRIDAVHEARRLGLPVVTGGQTISGLLPSQHTALSEALSGAQHVGARELPTLAIALGLGVPSARVGYQVDDAFLLAGRRPSRGPAAELSELPYLALTLDPSFGIPHGYGDLRRIAQQLALLAAFTGLQIVFMPHVGPLGESGDEDGRVGAAIGALLREHGTPYVLLPVMDSAETVWVTQRAAAIVSSRYHPLVFGSAAGVPAIGIHRDAYTRAKLEGALHHLGMIAWSLTAGDAATGGLVEMFARVWRDRASLRDAIESARAGIEVAEADRWDLLVDRLGWQPAVVDDVHAAAARDAQPFLTVHTGARSQRHHARKDRVAVESGSFLSEAQWADYRRDGYLRLGPLVDPDALDVLRRRADDLATGAVTNRDVQMQLDTGGSYDALAHIVNDAVGTVRYRKIQGLEHDDAFARLVRHPLFLEIAARQYGPHAPVSIFRAMVMNKPAHQGTVLPWHQDGGDVWALDRDPLVTIWLALDAAAVENGCVEVVPGSHRLGLLTASGSTLAGDDAARHCPAEQVVALEVEAGHGLLMHNWLIHRSGVNPSAQPRRAFTVCYMDGRTVSTLTGERFPSVTGAPWTSEPYPFVRQLHEDMHRIRGSEQQAAEYARSLERELARAADQRAEAERYARSLEAERSRVVVPFDRRAG